MLSSKRKEANDEQQVVDDNYLNSLNSLTSDTEEHFEFSPDLSDDTSGTCEQDGGGELNVSKLSSDSFRSNCSSSPGSGGHNPFPRNNHLRQSFNNRSSWARTNLRRSSGSHLFPMPHSATTNSSPNNKRSPANGHGRFNSLEEQLWDMEIQNDEKRIEDEKRFRDTVSRLEKEKLVSRLCSLRQELLEVKDEARKYLNQNEEAKTEKSDLEATLNDKVEENERLKQELSKVKESQKQSHLYKQVHSLEEQLRDMEVQLEERQKDEQKRLRDAMSRYEREKSQEFEKISSRVSLLEQELQNAKDEIRKYQVLCDKVKSERSNLEDIISDKAEELDHLRDELSRVKESLKQSHEENLSSQRMIKVLNQELTEQKMANSNGLQSGESNQSSLTSLNAKVQELERVIHHLRSENTSLKEGNGELQAQLLNVGLAEGRVLVREGERITTSLADELITLNEEQLRRGLVEQQEVNAKLRAYIDGILLNIVENYPQLLEVKGK